MIEAEWWEYDSLDELADAVAGDVGFIIESAVDARGSSLIAVPGGNTGPAIFPRLVAQKLPWKKVTVIPTDDRLVPMDDERSNVRAIGKAFIPSGARVIPIATDIVGLSACRKLGRCPAAGSSLAAGPCLARHGKGWPHRVDFRRSGPSGRARRPQGAARGRRYAGPAAAGSPGCAGDLDSRVDPVGPNGDDHDHRR